MKRLGCRETTFFFALAATKGCPCWTTFFFALLSITSKKYCTYDVGIILSKQLHILLQPEIFWAAAHVASEECAEMALILETETV